MDYTIKTILYATDLGPHGPEVFSHAVGLAEKFGAKIHIIHSVEPLSDYANSLIDTYLPADKLESLHQEGFERALKEIQRRLEAFCKDKLHSGDKLIAGMRVVEGLPAQTILAEAERLRADVIVLGSHGQSALSELLIGSVAHKVVIKSRVPVLLVPIRRN